MVVTQTLIPITEINRDTENEIIFPQGEFYSDEPPLESNILNKYLS